VPTGLPTLIPQPSQPESKSDLANPYAIVVQVMEDGKIMINREQTDWENLGARLSDIFKQRAEKVGFVDGAEDVPFADVPSNRHYARCGNRTHRDDHSSRQK
jgi:biopolymer transport protein ExbD